MARIDYGTSPPKPEASLGAQVEERVAALYAARDAALKKLAEQQITGFGNPLSFIFPDSGTPHALGNVKGPLTDAIDRWAVKGRAAAKAGKAPDYRGGWAGWVEVGITLQAGLKEAAGIEYDPLAMLTTVARETVRDVRRGAVKAASGVAWGALLPITVGIGLFLLLKGRLTK